MQQEEVLTELYSYIHQEPPPPNVASTIEAHKYLEAYSLIFENFFVMTKFVPWIPLFYKTFLKAISILLHGFQHCFLKVLDCTCNMP